MGRPTSLACLVVFLGAAACGDDGTTPPPGGIPAECNPLGGVTCLLPWPSAAYEVADATTASGVRLALPLEAMPVNIDQVAIDPVPYNRFDGFPPSAPILVVMPNGIAGAGLPPPEDPDASLAATSPIVLWNMDTHTRAPFFAEIDQNVEQPTERALIIRPLIRLAPASHYAVFLRDTLKDVDGAALAPPPAFAALRDDGAYEHPRLGRDRYPAIFAEATTAGLTKAELVLAWDFHTASDEFLTADLLAMRTTGLAAMGPVGANLTFTATSRAANPTRVSQAYVGTFTSPDFLTNGEADNSILRRDGAGVPQQQGMRDANFAAIIPKCAETAPLPLPVVVFGHGLFGSGSDYLDDDFLQKVADQYCYVVFGGDFIGLTDRQFTVAALAANDLNKGSWITEKLAQSVIDFIALEHAIRGPMRTAPEFKLGGVAGGAEIMDASRVYYLGGSLGGIMGNVFMAYDPTITRGALGVPGGAWTMLFERSIAWTALKGAATGAYPDPLVYELLVNLLGMKFEPYDPITTSGRVINDPLPNTPAKQILMWEAIGDCLVSNYSTETVARTMGLSLITPSVRTPWGIPPATGTITSAMTVLDEHPSPLPPSTTNAQPIEDNGTHSGVNKRQAVLDQVRAFILDGTITQTCQVGGTATACDCATGACGPRL
ncbi:MAG: hypothetical protein IPL61_05110 [Myxococcales bacterium]|nr:hypothetical protein [Myxococcales bacterium]